jgi:hypothetical protein
MSTSASQGAPSIQPSISSTSPAASVTATASSQSPRITNASSGTKPDVSFPPTSTNSSARNDTSVLSPIVIILISVGAFVVLGGICIICIRSYSSTTKTKRKKQKLGLVEANQAPSPSNQRSGYAVKIIPTGSEERRSRIKPSQVFVGANPGQYGSSQQALYSTQHHLYSQSAPNHYGYQAEASYVASAQPYYHDYAHSNGVQYMYENENYTQPYAANLQMESFYYPTMNLKQQPGFETTAIKAPPTNANDVQAKVISPVAISSQNDGEHSKETVKNVSYIHHRGSNESL